MNKFWQVMAFYAFLSCFLMPYLRNMFIGHSGLENGYILGTAVSIALWFVVGKKYINN